MLTKAKNSLFLAPQLPRSIFSYFASDIVSPGALHFGVRERAASPLGKMQPLWWLLCFKYGGLSYFTATL